MRWVQHPFDPSRPTSECMWVGKNADDWCTKPATYVLEDNGQIDLSERACDAHANETHIKMILEEMELDDES